MKIDRLMGIVVYLLNHGRTSAQKLAEVFEVSPRTIMRDMESLDHAGIPVQSFYGTDGGYQIMENYVLDKQAAAKHEYDWIITALQSLDSAYENKSLKQTLAKVEAIHPAGNKAVSLDFGVALEDERIGKYLKRLEEAIEKKCAVRFSYTNSNDEVRTLQIEPVCIQYKWYSWYLIGYYEKYQDYCMFKLVRMENLELTEIKNTRDHNPSDFHPKDSDESALRIRLYGKASVKAKCREYLNGQVTREYENGDFEFSFVVPAYETFWYGVLLSFGNRVKVIEPQALVERILESCREIQLVYKE